MSNYGWGGRRQIDDAERPFWISYADLMTALMVLFLVITVTALSVTVKYIDDVQLEVKGTPMSSVQTDVRMAAISNICDELSSRIKNTGSSAQVDCRLNRINFGEVGRFKPDEYKLQPDGEAALINVVAQILQTANTPLGKKWLKQVVVEGFTDTDGSYLYNLNLSLKRSEWVMCTLLTHSANVNHFFDHEQLVQIKKLFLSGGVSFNDHRSTKEESRRVELRLQFYGVGDRLQRGEEYEYKFSAQQKERCYI